MAPRPLQISATSPAGDAPLLNKSVGVIWQQWWRIAAIAGSAIVGALAGLAHALLLLFGAIVIANALAPVVTWLDQRLPGPWPSCSSTWRSRSVWAPSAGSWCRASPNRPSSSYLPRLRW